MSQPASMPSSLPEWMVIFAFFSSLLLTILAAIEILSRTLKKTSLEFLLTKETFIRLLEHGECIYADGVIVSYGSGAVIQAVNVLLEKTDGANKQFQLDVLNVGEKYRSDEGFSRHHFYSTSPLAFVPPDRPQRIIYLCSQQSYAESIQKHFNNYSMYLYELRNRYSQMTNMDQNTTQALLDEIRSAVNEVCNKVMDQVQLEAGNYRLTLSLQYRQQRKLIPIFQLKMAKSSIEFSIDSNVREFMRNQLQKAVETRALNFLTNQQNPISYPEFIPTDLKEIS